MTRTTAPRSLTEAQAMATIDAMRTSDDLKAAMRRQWITNAPGARFSVLGAYLRLNGQR
jgi:hypothetical protein